MTKNSIKHVLFFFRENAVVTQGDRRMFPKRLRALQKLRESLNNSMDCFTYKDYFTYVCLTNTFHVAVRLYLSNRCTAIHNMDAIWFEFWMKGGLPTVEICVLYG